MWRFCDVVGLFFLQRPWETCWGTWHHDLNQIPGNCKTESGCPCQETKTGSSLDPPAEQWSKKSPNEHKNGYLNTKASFCHGHLSPLTQTYGLSSRGVCTREDLGLWMIWRDSAQRNGLRFLFLHSTTLLEVTGEDMLFYWWVFLYKVLNTGVPIILAHMVLFKIIISKWGISFSQNKCTSIKG